MCVRLINNFINIFKFIWLPLIIPFRYNCRVYVYNYFIKNKILFLFQGENIELRENTYYLDNVIFIPYKETNKYVYFLYFVFIYMWMDDETYDNIDIERLSELKLTKPFIYKLIEKDIKKILQKYPKRAFKNPNYRFNVNNFIFLFYISMFYTKNNFYNYKSYSKKKTKLYKKLVFKNKYPMFKL